MKVLIDYIKNKNEDLKNVEYELLEGKSKNTLVDETDDYRLYCGEHVFNRLYRHTLETGNYGDKISLKSVKKTVKDGFYRIENCFNNNNLCADDPHSTLCIVDKKYRPNLNVVIFIDKFDGKKYDIIVKTVMKTNNFNSQTKRSINECKVIDNMLFIEIN